MMQEKKFTVLVVPCFSSTNQIRQCDQVSKEIKAVKQWHDQSAIHLPNGPLSKKQALSNVNHHLRPKNDVINVFLLYCKIMCRLKEVIGFFFVKCREMWH